MDCKDQFNHSAVGAGMLILPSRWGLAVDWEGGRGERQCKKKKKKKKKQISIVAVAKLK